MRAFELALCALAMLSCSTAYDVHIPGVTKWRGAPELETFASYEDMQRYFISRNQRSLRQLDNPTEDSYISAYNEHNEEPAVTNVRPRSKRAAAAAAVMARKLPNEPTLVKFEISDAAEPSAEVKELIRQHRSREDQLAAKNTTAAEAEATNGARNAQKRNTKTSAKLKAHRSGTRVKRNARREPFNLQVQLIPFELADAREPDEQTKALIKRMRALELEKIATSTATPTPTAAASTTARNAVLANLAAPPRTTVPLHQPTFVRPKAAKHFLQRKGKRIRRAAPLTPPQMFKFELADAAMQPSIHRATRESKALTLTPNATQPVRRDMQADLGDADDSKATADAADAAVDLSNEESKRHFVYKEAPGLKAKKSINNLPHEVQKVITHLLKEGHGGKAYVKYIPAQHVDYRQLKSLYGAKAAQPVYAGKLSPASYVKYVQPLQKAQQVQVQIHPVPVVEKVRYIYTPVAGVGAGGGHEQHAAVQAAAAHAVQAAHAANTVHAVAEAQAAQAAHAAHVAQAAQAGHAAEGAHGNGAYAAPNYEAHASGGNGGGGAYAGIAHPIVVHDNDGAVHQQQAPIAVHHTYAADLSQVHDMGAHFRPSKPDPLQNDNKQAEAPQHAAPVEHYKYEVYSPPPNDYASAYVKPQQHAAAGGGGDGDGDGSAGGGGDGGDGSDGGGGYQHAVAAEAAAPIIKIEYHAPADPIKENYKQLPEFKQLSTLIGKSTDDQIHGLTYLLAKEMQNKLQLERQHSAAASHAPNESSAQRAHTNTAPILFHPEQAQYQHHQQQQQQQQLHAPQGHHIGLHAGRLIGMAKSKEYIPIVENAAPAAEQKAAGGEAEQAVPAAKQYAVLKLAPKAPAPNSFIEYGLSPNYAGVKGQGNKANLLVEQVIHHPTVTHHGAVGVGSHQGLHAAAAANHAGGGAGGHAGKQAGGAGGAIQHGDGGHSVSYGVHNGDGLQYASKYAFGYRIRDFHTGNDFGHKQNRDLDGVTRGQYHILLPDGRIQNVIYHADDTGFHADVSFETGH